MNKKPGSTQKIFDIILASVTWVGFFLQLLYADNITNTFSYFTIQTNLLIAISLSITLLAPHSIVSRYFSKITVQSALVVYIIIVSLVYNFTIRSSWVQPIPLAIYDNIVHIVTPLLYVIRWFIFIQKGTLKWHHGLLWLVYPLAYFFYSLIRGSIINWYPYFFLDLRKISYTELTRNILLVSLLFLVTSEVLIAMDYIINKKQIKN